MERPPLRIVRPRLVPLPTADDQLGFGDALDRVPFACLRLTARGVVEKANPAASDLIGLSLYRRGGPVLSAYVGPHDMARFFQYVRDLHGSIEAQRCTLRFVRPGRREDRWLELYGRQLVGAQDACALVALTDVSERVRADEQVRENELRLRTLIEALPDAVLVVSGETVVQANPAASSLIGTNPTGRSFVDLIARDQRSLVASFFRSNLPAAERERHELRFVTTSGHERVVETQWLSIVLDDQHARLCVARDRTEQRQLEAQLAHRDRMSSMGVLASGVAHELNNPLTYILMNLSEIVEELSQSDDATAEKLVQLGREALDGVNRMARIVRDLRSFTRVSDKLAPVSVNEAVRRALSLASPQSRHLVEVVENLGQVPAVLAEEGRLVQVVLNLVLNAFQAAPEGTGRVEVHTEVARDQVCISVKDNGPGISSQVANRLFEPFVTTKEIGKGTGLGLFVCHQYVQQCGGTIEVQSPIGQGATFIVHLPIAAEKVSASGVHVPAVLPPKRAARMLIIDDDPGIRVALKASLADLAEIVVAEDATVAKDLLAADRDFDAILCDVLMPGGGGPSLYEWVVTHQPDLLARLCFMTGGTFTPQTNEFLIRAAPPYISKPFTKAELTRFLLQRCPTAPLGERSLR